MRLIRRVPAGSFDRLTTIEALWSAWRRSREGKRHSPSVARFAIDVDTRLFKLRDALHGGEWRPGPPGLSCVYDPKRRLIAAPPVIDRVVHQALVTEIAPHYDRSAIDHSYATGTGRGPLRAVLYHLNCMRATRWRMHLDIRRYFPSIDPERVFQLITRRLRDRATLALVEHILAAGVAVYRDPLAIEVCGLDVNPLPPGRGLPIGTYFSQWAANLYLDGLDHHVKRALGIRHYLRFMDDFTLFADDPEQLEDARGIITEWLAEERGLTLNPKHGAVQSTRRGCVFLGYRVTRAGLRPGPKMRRRMPRRLAEAAKHGPDALARTVAAYRGLWGASPAVWARLPDELSLS